MRRDDALAILQAHRDEIRSHHVTSLSIFGSVARDEAGPDSDVDLIVEFDEQAPVGLFEFVRFQHRMEAILGRRVHLATANSLRQPIRDRVLREAIRAA